MFQTSVGFLNIKLLCCFYKISVDVTSPCTINVFMRWGRGGFIYGVFIDRSLSVCLCVFKIAYRSVVASL